MQTSEILYFVPTLIAYLYLENFIYSSRFNRLSVAFTEVFKRWNQSAEQNELDSYVTPWLPLYWDVCRTARNRVIPCSSACFLA